MEETSDKMMQLGKKFIIGFTVPIILFFIGFLFLLFGFIL